MELISVDVLRRKDVTIPGPIAIDVDDITRPMEDIGGGESRVHLREVRDENRASATLEQIPYDINETLAVIAAKADSLILLNINSRDGRPINPSEPRVFNRTFFTGPILPEGGGARFFNKEEGNDRLVEYFVDEDVATIVGSSSSSTPSQFIHDKTIFVDPNGDDVVAAVDVYRIDQPFATPEAALAAASAGDTIWVFPGIYAIASSLAADDIDWHLVDGVVLNGDNGIKIFDNSDPISPKNFNVTGAGILNADGETAIHQASNSTTSFECKEINADAFTACLLSTGSITIKCQKINRTGAGLGNTIELNADSIARIDADNIEHNGSAGGHTIACLVGFQGIATINCQDIVAPLSILDTHAVFMDATVVASAVLTINGNITDLRATNTTIAADGNATVAIVAGGFVMNGNIVADAYRALVSYGATTGSVKFTGDMISNTDLSAALMAESSGVEIFVKETSVVKCTGPAAATVSIGEAILAAGVALGCYLEIDGIVINEDPGGSADGIVKAGVGASDNTLVMNTLKIISASGTNSIFAANAQDVIINHKVTANRDVDAFINNLVNPNQFSFDPDVI